MRLRRKHPAVRLSDGAVLTTANEWYRPEGMSSWWDRIHLRLTDASGTPLVDDVTLPPSRDSYRGVRLVHHPDSDTVSLLTQANRLVYDSEGKPTGRAQTVEVQRLDRSLSPLGEVQVLQSGPSEGMHALPDGDGGLIVASFTARDPETRADTLTVAHYDDQGERLEVLFEADGLYSRTIELGAFDDGRLVVLCHRLTERGSNTFHAWVLGADGSLQAEHHLMTGYAEWATATTGADGRMLLTWGEGGYTRWALLDADEGLVRGPHPLDDAGTSHSRAHAASLTDGGWVVASATTDTKELMLHHFDRQGRLRPQRSLLLTSAAQEYDGVQAVLPDQEGGFAVVAQSAWFDEEGIQVHPAVRGIVTLDEQEGSAALTNHSAAPVEVELTAWRQGE